MLITRRKWSRQSSFSTNMENKPTVSQKIEEAKNGKLKEITSTDIPYAELPNNDDVGAKIIALPNLREAVIGVGNESMRADKSGLWFGNKRFASASLSISIDGLLKVKSFTVATLPTSASVGTIVYATDGRKNGEGAGSGTGVLVFFDANDDWCAVDTGTPVAA